MKKFFELHEYTKNMKAMIGIFSLKGKSYIWWEDVKLVRDIKTKELRWHKFKKLFRKKYLLEKYYGRKANEFYELKMGYVTNEEYMNKFLNLLRYVSYLKDEKTKGKRFISGLPLAFNNQIEYDEPRSLEEVIGKLKHCYEQLKHKTKSKKGWKGNDKVKGKWPPKQGRSQDSSEKENVSPYKKFNAVEKGHGSQLGEQ